MSSNIRQSCLIVLSSAIEGVSTPSFMQVFQLAQTNFNIQLASPGGETVEYVQQDEVSRKWLNDFRTKSYAKPIKFEAVEASHYAALIFPHAMGSTKDLIRNEELAKIVKHFCHERKPICTVGMGVVGLFPATNDDRSWIFKGYSMTSTTVFELARLSSFATQSVIPEDFIRDHGAQFSHSDVGCLHVVVDRHLITGQNEQSTVIAIQNLILFCSQKVGK